MSRQPVRGQKVRYCICWEWFTTERDYERHQRRCPGSPVASPQPSFLKDLSKRRLTPRSMP